jgi:hypothetical protein
MLNQHPELLRATKFVGQSQGKQEIDKGFNQKEQKKVRDLYHSLPDVMLTGTDDPRIQRRQIQYPSFYLYRGRRSGHRRS